MFTKKDAPILVTNAISPIQLNDSFVKLYAFFKKISRVPWKENRRGKVKRLPKRLKLKAEQLELTEALPLSQFVCPSVVPCPAPSCEFDTKFCFC